jgi:hypothetical protein
VELSGRWMHSREEDEGDVQVYRPADWAFPPARGRRGIEFGPGGELLLIGPGPTDRPQARAGRLEDLEIVTQEPDRLTVRWRA